MAQARRWCFTLNNYTDAEVTQIREACRGSQISYAVFGKETGESGTPHLQGYLSLARSQRLSFLRRFISGRAHFEQSRGSPEQASEYCKKDGDFEEFGTLPTKKNNSNWSRFKEWLSDHDERPSEADIFNEFPQLYGQYYAGVCRILDLLFPAPPPVNWETTTLREWQ